MIQARTLAQQINRLTPGSALVIPQVVLLDVACIPGYTPTETLMENIVGSAYSIRTFWDPISGDTTFMRLFGDPPDGCRTYVSPDRREFFQLRPDGFYERTNAA